MKKRNNYFYPYLVLIIFIIVFLIVSFLTLYIVYEKKQLSQSKEKLSERYYCIQTHDGYKINSWDGGFVMHGSQQNDFDSSLNKVGLNRSNCFTQLQIEEFCKNSAKYLPFNLTAFSIFKEENCGMLP